MKRYGFLTAVCGVLVASGGLVLATGDGATPREGANHHQPQPPPRYNPFRQILDELQEIKDLLTSHQGGDTQGLTQNWDKVLPAETRFVVLADFGGAAVRDNETGLVWEQAPSVNDMGWGIARYACAYKRLGGREGWRLPSFAELASLLDPSVAPPGPILPPGHPFSLFGRVYWSATSAGPGNAWLVDFSGNSYHTKGGDVLAAETDTSFIYTWCVRGPGPLATY